MRLEDVIRNNREAFNSEEPEQGHVERFEQRLKASKKNNKQQTTSRLIKIAAMLVGIITGLTYYMNRDQNSSPFCQQSEEMMNTQNYYLSIINSQAKQAKELLANADQETQTEVGNDIQAIVNGSDSFAREFCNSSEGGIAIMVEFYHAKIQALQNIISVFEANDPQSIGHPSKSHADA